MPPESENKVQYSSAMEFTGPPVPYALARAFPINLEKIPVAAVVSKVSLSDTEFRIPFLPPISAPGRIMFSNELHSTVSSPTSVINTCNCASKELELGSKTTIFRILLLNLRK